MHAYHQRRGHEERSKRMTDVSTQLGNESPQRAERTSSVARRSETPGGLQTEKGQTTIADPVVTKVAGIAAREVGGVYQLGGAVGRALGAVANRLPVGDNTTQGVSVEVGDKEAAVDLTVVVEYGESIPRVAQEIRQNVVRRIEGITGLSVTEVNVAVNDLHLPTDDDHDDQSSRVQ
jgi:uncharacterized alkaline shock family protein YloU